MKIKLDTTALHQSSWIGHVLRFVAGGLVTVGVGVFTKATNAKAGGLMLAIPSIVPLGIALIAHLQSKLPGTTERHDRGRHAAMLQATGAAFGTVGLLAFALVAWQLLLRAPAWVALSAATLAWAVVAAGIWLARKSRRRA